MAPEYGATMGFFPIDDNTLTYLRLTGREESKVKLIEKYLKESGGFVTYDGKNDFPNYSGEIMELDLNSVEPSVSGPKRPHDRVALSNMKKDFTAALTNKVGFKGYGYPNEHTNMVGQFHYKGTDYELKHGSVVIAAITSCTNTSNPGVMLAAGMLAKNAVEKGLSVKPYIKTSLSPGSGVVTQYFEAAGVDKYLDQLGFTTAGYGCMTCIGNSGELPTEVQDTIVNKDIVASAVLSGNRNFEGRVHPNTRANYLASPPLVVAYAIAGTVDIDFEKDPLGKDKSGKDVFLKDIWPSRDEIEKMTSKVMNSKMFTDVYGHILKGSKMW